MRPLRPGRKEAGQRGFALLLVFAMAAAIAIMMYLEFPRVTFEHQRDKEALLLDRGRQFIRAIDLYQRKLKKYPQTLDDLEGAQNIRFLRRRYTDPMTGSDEWRLVHVDAGGQYTDSKVHKKAGALDKQDNGPSILASTVQGIGAQATVIDLSGQTTSPALQRRASDRISPGSTPGQAASAAGPDETVQPESGSEAAPNSSQSDNQAPAASTAVTPAPVQGGGFRNPFLPPGVSAPTGAQQVQTPSGSTDQAAAGSSLLSNAPQSNAPGSGQPLTPFAGTGAAGTGAGAAAGQSGTGSGFLSQSGGFGTPPTPPAIQQIQQILGSQRGGATASGTGMGTGAGTSMGPSALGAGLVGVASKKEQPSIRAYKGQSNYSLWEFVFDPRESAQNKSGAGGAGGTAPGAATGAAGNPSGSSSTSVFGGMSGGTPAPAGPSGN
ncbi:MAG: hypothetical protein ACLQBJ_16315 [Bryobacteraceae bacterium]